MEEGALEPGEIKEAITDPSRNRALTASGARYIMDASATE